MAGVPKIIIKDLDAKLGWYVRRAAVEIGEQIQEYYEDAITQFYMSYDPKIYDRTYSLYEGSIGVGGRGVYIKKDGRYGYSCGIEVGHEFYSYNPYVKTPSKSGKIHGQEMNPEKVFPSAFDKGIHGFTSYTVKMAHKNPNSEKKYWKIKGASVPRKTTPPKKKLDENFNSIDNFDYVYGKIVGALEAAGDLIEIK